MAWQAAHSCGRLAGESAEKEAASASPEGGAPYLGKQQQQVQSGPFTWPV